MHSMVVSQSQKKDRSIWMTTVHGIIINIFAADSRQQTAATSQQPNSTRVSAMSVVQKRGAGWSWISHARIPLILILIPPTLQVACLCLLSFTSPVVSSFQSFSVSGSVVRAKYILDN